MNKSGNFIWYISIGFALSDLARKVFITSGCFQVWIPLIWRRSNLVFSSYAMGLFGLFVIEFSLWNNFGDYIWHISIGFALLDMFVGDIVSYQLKEVKRRVRCNCAIQRSQLISKETQLMPSKSDCNKHMHSLILQASSHRLRKRSIMQIYGVV